MHSTSQVASLYNVNSTGDNLRSFATDHQLCPPFHPSVCKVYSVYHFKYADQFMRTCLFEQKNEKQKQVG